VTDVVIQFCSGEVKGAKRKSQSDLTFQIENNSADRPDRKVAIDGPVVIEAGWV